MNWDELERAAPIIAQLGKKQLNRTRVALLGTLRRDGSPRISPIEPYLSQGHLVFGGMSWSRKTNDLMRDPRCALHSAITSPDSGEGELKLYGRATVAESAIRDGCQDGWWLERPRSVATVFVLDIEEAAFISWALGEGKLIVRRWSLEGGYTEKERSYP